MNRHIVISNDCHTFGPGNGSMDTDQLDLMTPYFEQRYRPAYEEYAGSLRSMFGARQQSVTAGLFDQKATSSFAEQEAVAGGGTRGLFDSDLRIKELEDDGIAAEVLFPNGVPFASGFLGSYEVELRAAGSRAYNRWLADFCGEAPGRRAGMASVEFHDVDKAVEEIRAAGEMGLRGVLLPPSWAAQGLPPYMDERYEPIWSACEDLELPLNTHGGTPLSDINMMDYGAAGMLVFATETIFASTRAFTQFVWGAVFERHPRLTLVFTESKADWVPDRLMYMDGIYGDKLFRHMRDTVKHSPSEYFRRQCHVAASFMSRPEALMRHAIGLDRLMWGADYPHYEGTWPHSHDWLVSTFAGLPAGEVEQILAANPARLWGFDLDFLRPIADRIGPDADELERSEPNVKLWRW